VIETVVPALIATVIATALTRAAVGAGPIYGQQTFVVTSAGELAAFAVAALVAAVFAFGFTRLVMLGERAFRRPWLRAPWRQALGGLGAGAIIVFVPQVAGNGYEPLQSILDGETGVKVIALLLVAMCGLPRRRGPRCARARRRSAGRLRARRHGGRHRRGDTRAVHGGDPVLRAVGRLRGRAAARARDGDRDGALACAPSRLDLHGRASRARSVVGVSAPEIADTSISAGG
jgi:hypothetical protein